MATFEEEVNEIVANSTVGEDGNLQLPEGIEASEQVLFAAKLEKRHRDTQSSYTKSQQAVKRLQAQNSKLAESWEADAMESLTLTQRTKLDELKVQDPDAYIAEISVIKEQSKATFDKKKEDLLAEANEMTELEVRQSQLDAYNEANPEAIISDKSIEDDVPPRIVKKLEKGEITFEDFLLEAKKYLTTGKSIKKEKGVEEEPDLSKANGSDSPSYSSQLAKNSNDYSKEIF